jgi:uroporphyrinogen-III synthase
MRCQAVEGQVTLRPMADNDAARPRATLLLTRPRAASERFSAEIIRRDLPLDIVIAPLMEIVATDPPPPLPVGAELIFTSSNAVGLAGRGAGQRAWCVGARTASAATQAGFDGVVAGFSADDLVALLNDERPGARLVHLRGRHQRGDVADRLAAAGLSVTSHVVYEQVAVPPDASFTAALTKAPLLVTLFSPRSAELFAKAAGPSWQPGPDCTIVTLSPAVRAVLPTEWRPNTVVSQRADGPSILDAVARRIFP